MAKMYAFVSNVCHSGVTVLFLTKIRWPKEKHL